MTTSRKSRFALFITMVSGLTGVVLRRLGKGASRSSSSSSIGLPSSCTSSSSSPSSNTEDSYSSSVGCCVPLNLVALSFLFWSNSEPNLPTSISFPSLVERTTTKTNITPTRSSADNKVSLEKPLVKLTLGKFLRLWHLEEVGPRIFSTYASSMEAIESGIGVRNVSVMYLIMPSSSACMRSVGVDPKIPQRESPKEIGKKALSTWCCPRAP